MEEKSNAFLETEPVGKLMAKYAVPCVISLLVAALYNVVDQIFIANATYLGSFGNAANTVVFPMTVVALAIAVLIGDGCCAFVSLSLGGGREEDAHKSIGSAIILCILCSIVLTAVYLIFMEPILTLFGGKVNEETYAWRQGVFLLDLPGRSVLYVRSGHEPHHSFRRQSEVCHGGNAGRCGDESGAGSDFDLSPAHGYDGRCGGNGIGTDFNGGTEHLVPVSHEGRASPQNQLWPVWRP